MLGAIHSFADVLPTDQLLASRNLPSLRTPEYQYYIRQSQNNGSYWTSETKGTTNKTNAGKFSFYAVPGLDHCYYIYSVDQRKWVNYNKTNRDNQKGFVILSDNFDANAYWEITLNTLKDQPSVSCYQMRPTEYRTSYEGTLPIQSNRYANWYEGDKDYTIGLWQQASDVDAGSAWSVESVTSSDETTLLQKIALANHILEVEGYAYTKGDNIITTDNISTILSSPYTSTAEGNITKLVDGDASTHWHSDYSADKINGSHYIAANLSTLTVPALMSFKYVRRSGANADQTLRWAVYGVPADESRITNASRDGLTLLAVITTTPSSTTTFDNLPPFETKGFTKFRFYCEATNYNRGYFHIGDFQLNSCTAAESNSPELKALAAAISLTGTNTEKITALNSALTPFMATETATNDAQALLDLTGVGYPATNAVGRTLLKQALGSGVAARELTTLIAAYKSSTLVNLPEGGKIYKLAFVNKNAVEYRIIANGNTLSVSKTEEATPFYCYKFTNYDGASRYAFISPEGKVLSYHALSDNYIVHNSDLEKYQPNDFSIACMTGVTSNVTGDASLRFGTLSMTTNNRLSGEYKENAGCFILTYSVNNLPFDNSSSAYFNDTYTSAIRFTEVSGSATTNQQIKVSTIDPLIKGFKYTIGEGLGKFSYTYAGTTGTDLTAYENAINTATSVIGSSDVTLSLNMPTAGFYRIKSRNASYADRRVKYILSRAKVNSEGTALGLEMSSVADVNSILYLNSTFVGYANGLYLNNYVSPATVGTAGLAWSIGANPSVIGAYTLKKNADTYCLSDWYSGEYTTNGQNDGSAAWAIEPVERLPFTFKAAAKGYSTFHCPVAVQLPENVTAYFGQILSDGSTLKMWRIEGNVVPKNTPVLLYNSTVESSDVEVELTLTTSSDSYSETNSLVGTVAAETLPTGKTCYSLQVGSESGDMGFYEKSSGNKAGFKAWIEIANASVREFRIIFDGENTTGLVEALGLENKKVAIYDLSGRRLNSTTTGVNVVNGKVTIVR